MSAASAAFAAAPAVVARARRGNASSAMSAARRSKKKRDRRVSRDAARRPSFSSSAFASRDDSSSLATSNARRRRALPPARSGNGDEDANDRAPEEASRDAASAPGPNAPAGKKKSAPSSPLPQLSQALGTASEVGVETVLKVAASRGKVWNGRIKLAYAAVSALIALNAVALFFPNGFGAPAAAPELLRVAEVMVLAASALLGALNFGPQAGKQVQGGALGLKNFGVQRATAREFLGLVCLKIIFDMFGLISLAIPLTWLPGWLVGARCAGMCVTMLGHSVFVEQCGTLRCTFTADGSTMNIPPKVIELVAMGDRTLALLVFSVAAGVYSNAPYVALPSAAIFLAGAVYFTFENKKARPKPKLNL
jgi:hypothetical protein